MWEYWWVCVCCWQGAKLSDKEDSDHGDKSDPHRHLNINLDEWVHYAVKRISLKLEQPHFMLILDFGGFAGFLVIFYTIEKCCFALLVAGLCVLMKSCLWDVTAKLCHLRQRRQEEERVTTQRTSKTTRASTSLNTRYVPMLPLTVLCLLREMYSSVSRIQLILYWCV